MRAVSEFTLPLGRCSHCGARPLTWSPGTIIETIRAWYIEHGRPPRANEWRASTPHTPSEVIVRRAFGSWANGIKAAGLKPGVTGRPFAFTKQEAVEAILDHVLSTGEWPKYRDWGKPGTGRPTASQVQRLFGSWQAGMYAAGRQSLRDDKAA